MFTTKPPKHRHLFKSTFVMKLIFLLFDTFQASHQSQPTETTTESSEWKVVGFALPPSILNF